MFSRFVVISGKKLFFNLKMKYMFNYSNIVLFLESKQKEQIKISETIYSNYNNIYSKLFIQTLWQDRFD